MINILKAYNDLYFFNGSRGDETSSQIFLFHDRHSKLILTAPHATRSFANKKEKLADLYTGALTQYIGEITQTSTIIRQKFTPYRALISDYIAQIELQDHYFLDIHGFNQNIPYDVCFGIASFQEQDYPFLNQIIQTAKKYKLRTIVNHPSYTGKFGLTGRYQKIFNTPNVIQIELSRHLRDFYQNPDIVEHTTVPFLCEICKFYK